MFEGYLYHPSRELYLRVTKADFVYMNLSHESRNLFLFLMKYTNVFTKVIFKTIELRLIYCVPGSMLGVLHASSFGYFNSVSLDRVFIFINVQI